MREPRTNTRPLDGLRLAEAHIPYAAALAKNLGERVNAAHVGRGPSESSDTASPTSLQNSSRSKRELDAVPGRSPRPLLQGDSSPTSKCASRDPRMEMRRVAAEIGARNHRAGDARPLRHRRWVYGARRATSCATRGACPGV